MLRLEGLSHLPGLPSNLSGNRIWNRQQPINKLPSELLTRIFTISEEEARISRGRYTKYFTIPEIATKVCHDWREISIISCSLWTYIRISRKLPNPLVSLVLERAGPTALLDLDIELGPRYCRDAGVSKSDWVSQLSLLEYMFAFLSASGAGAHRWRTVLFYGTQSEVLCKFIGYLGAEVLPALQSVTLRQNKLLIPLDIYDNRYMQFPNLITTPTGQANAPLPSLHRVELRFIPGSFLFQRCQFLLTGLTRLDLTFRSELGSIAELQDVLVANPMLESLSLDSTFLRKNVDITIAELPRVQLLFLRSLSVGRRHHPLSTLSVLWMIQAPNLHHFSMIPSSWPIVVEFFPTTIDLDVLKYVCTGLLPDDSRSPSMISGASAPIYPALRDLDISCMSISSPDLKNQVAALLYLFSSVTRLTLAAVQVDIIREAIGVLLPNLRCIKLTSYRSTILLGELLYHRAAIELPIQVVELPPGQVQRALTDIFDEELRDTVHIIPHQDIEIEHENDSTPSIWDFSDDELGSSGEGADSEVEGRDGFDNSGNEDDSVVGESIGS